MVNFTWEHSNEDEHEEESGYGKDQHENALHEACHHVPRLVLYLFNLRVGSINILLVQLTNILNHSFIFLELILEAPGDIFHAFGHLKHIFLELRSFFCLIPFDLVVVYTP